MARANWAGEGKVAEILDLVPTAGGGGAGLARQILPPVAGVGMHGPARAGARFPIRWAGLNLLLTPGRYLQD